ncbi:hypothetical protein GTCCBUS3UF5_23080 [Geobacillus thermoleovorans CCB_US3_UF5]|uniref:Uncharacterized protein n=2 Tax=Geobacillus thermoleovorans group TaxID=1505648 RepID=U2Y8T4_GEOKU|nr:hypothetical protein GTCCBUS3UF5_23080 [Geobacillus thermoleovorans CCB_US3_UF5]GAD13128.1 hypothetical protein GBL_1345 [Geobacillus kaustophilus GBlys]GAJ58642.1 hypothetical protein B23_1853 [Geobacillus thermoleovorans B23]
MKLPKLRPHVCMPLRAACFFSGAALFYSFCFFVRLASVIKVCYDYISKTR